MLPAKRKKKGRWALGVWVCTCDEGTDIFWDGQWPGEGGPSIQVGGNKTLVTA